MFYKATSLVTGWHGYCRVGEVIQRYHCIGLVREGYLALRGGYAIGLIQLGRFGYYFGCTGCAQ